jgi:guanylate kinase
LDRGRLIVVSGPSGAGKSTLIRQALDVVPGLTYSVSATTRAPREGEVDGRDYIFLTREEFEERIREGWFLEWAEYSGNLYGTPEHRVEELLSKGLSVILEIELQGARKVREKRPEAVMIFVQAPSLEETRKRLEGRATEDEKALEVRMTTALTEVSAKDEFDYEVINSDRWQAREGITRIMRNIVEGGTENVE